MEWDEMKAQWTAEHRQLQDSLRLNAKLYQALQVRGAKTAMDRFSLGVMMHAALWLAIVIILGSYIYDHLALPQYAIPAIVLDIYSIAVFAGLLRQFITARSLDYSAPMVAVQASLERLRMGRIKTTQWAVFAGVALWAPALIVLLNGAFDVNAYRVLNVPWLIANVVFGLAMIPVLLWVSRRMAERVDDSPFLQQVMRDLAGRSLSNATQYMQELVGFGREK